MAADALSFSRKEAGSSAGHAAGDRATGVARTRSGPRWVCPTLPPTAVPDGATLTIPLHVRIVNPQIRLVYRLSVPRRSALTRRALWYSAAFVALAALVDITDFDRLNAFAVRNLQPLAGGNGHPQMREWTEVLISPAGPMITALVIAAAAICLLAQAPEPGGGGLAGGAGAGAGGRDRLQAGGRTAPQRHLARLRADARLVVSERPHAARDPDRRRGGRGDPGAAGRAGPVVRGRRRSAC